MANVDYVKEYINQGEFTEKVQLQESVVVKDSRSASVREFTTKYTAYAKVEESNSPEAIINEGSRMRTTIAVTTYSAPINSRWRVKWNGNDFDVTTVTQLLRTPFMKLEAIKVI